MLADLPEIRRQLEDLLWEWDFLDLGDHRPSTEDEYECLLWPLYGILSRGGTSDDIQSCLESELIEHFGVPAPESTSAFAENLLAWYQARSN
jgi:hypothetical protein